MSTSPTDLDETPSGLEDEIRRGIVEGESPNHPIRQWLHGIRESVAERPRLNLLYRIFIALFGGLIMLVGIIMIPLPGPGWLTVFLGLAVLSTEYHWAKRVSNYAKAQLGRFWTWWNARRARRRASRQR